MKHTYALRNLLFACFILGVSATVNGQTGISHPLAFGYIGTDSSNWYKDYVGVRFEVTNPGSVAGNKLFSVATVADGWTSTHPVTSPIVNVAIAMPPLADSCACTGLTASSMTGKIAVIWRGPESTPCEFGYKAAQAQFAGAIACVVINEYAGGLPIGMGAGASGAAVTIPCFMISNADGIAITNAYKAELASLSTTDSVRMTITPWGLELRNDLGFFNNGISLWHDYAIPYSQLAGPSQVLTVPYMGLHGAYIANFGTSNGKNVKLVGTSTYISADGSITALHSDTSSTLTTFTSLDSIYAFFSPQFTFAVPSNGSVHVTYAIVQDSVDQYPEDDTTSFTFYASDSVFSKGRFDFVNNVPLCNLYEAPGVSASDDHYIWGPFYYVKNAGSYAEAVKWSMTSTAGTTTGSIGSDVNVYLFKWIDGHGGEPMDSFVQNGELELVGVAVKDFTSDTVAGDTAGGNFTCFFSTDTTASVVPSGPLVPPSLDSNSWYYVAVEAPTQPTVWFMGCDGINDDYPRTYGRNHFYSFLEYYSTVYGADRYVDIDAMVNNPNSALQPCPFGGSYNTDSVVFSTQEGMIPNVALVATYVKPTISAVKTVNSNEVKFNVYPNPASDYVNVSIGLSNTAKVVTYTILDGMARDVTKQTHYNVLNDNFTYSTAGLPSGNYYMVVNVDSKAMFKKFTVLRN